VINPRAVGVSLSRGAILFDFKFQSGTAFGPEASAVSQVSKVYHHESDHETRQYRMKLLTAFFVRSCVSW
jgi:hypothetical protein